MIPSNATFKAKDNIRFELCKMLSYTAKRYKLCKLAYHGDCNLLKELKAIKQNSKLEFCRTESPSEDMLFAYRQAASDVDDVITNVQHYVSRMASYKKQIKLLQTMVNDIDKDLK